MDEVWGSFRSFPSNFWSAAKNWWKEDKHRRWLFVGAFAYAWILCQGIPVWDDDFTSWYWKLKDHTIFKYVFEWLSPISTQPEHWGFNERPMQAFVYKLFYYIAGYDSWIHVLYKSLVCGGIAVMIYQWALRLVPKGLWGTYAAMASAVFFTLIPPLAASHIILSDFAPTAELIFLCLTYVIWEEIENTPTTWKGMPQFKDAARKQWLVRWSWIAFFTYLGYKSKADLKLIPAITAAYVLLTRRKQWAYFAVPVGIMVFLAVPWGAGIFTKLPPFLPGSRGSEVDWMWQPASFDRFREFLWSTGTHGFWDMVRSPTMSIAAMIGPFLLIPLAVFLSWRMEALDQVPWLTLSRPLDRARTFILLWFVVVLAGVSALPALNYIFRVRYGVIPMVPLSILMAWAFGLFVEKMDRIPKWTWAVAGAALALQCGANLYRSVVFRKDMGMMMVSVDRTYEYISKNHGDKKLVMLPDFRPYDYRPDASPNIHGRDWLTQNEELARKGYVPGQTLVLSWSPSFWDQLEMVEAVPGCRSTTIFDHLFPCSPGSGAQVMKYIGIDPLYGQGELLRSQKNFVEAEKLHEQFLAKYPKSVAGHFVHGLEAYELKEYAKASQSFAFVESYFPTHLGVLYDHALVLAGMKDYAGAIQRLKQVIQVEPNNYSALINLYYTYANSNRTAEAKDVAVQMKRYYPQDQEIDRLVAGH